MHQLAISPNPCINTLWTTEGKGSDEGGLNSNLFGTTSKKLGRWTRPIKGHRKRSMLFYQNNHLIVQVQSNQKEDINQIIQLYSKTNWQPCLTHILMHYGQRKAKWFWESILFSQSGIIFETLEYEQKLLKSKKRYLIKLFEEKVRTKRNFKEVNEWRTSFQIILIW
jgi:transposase-like protein